MTLFKTTTIASALLLSTIALSTTAYSQISAGSSGTYSMEAETNNPAVNSNIGLDASPNTTIDTGVDNDYNASIDNESDYNRVETGVDTRFENEASVDSIGGSNAEIDYDGDLNTSPYNN